MIIKVQTTTSKASCRKKKRSPLANTNSVRRGNCWGEPSVIPETARSAVVRNPDANSEPTSGFRARPSGPARNDRFAEAEPFVRTAPLRPGKSARYARLAGNCVRPEERSRSRSFRNRFRAKDIQGRVVKCDAPIGWSPSCETDLPRICQVAHDCLQKSDQKKEQFAYGINLS